MPTKFKFDEVLQRIEQTKNELPRVLANQAQRHFVGSFREQGLDGDAWEEVQRRIPGTPEYKYPANKGLSRRTKPILIGTGRLRRGVNDSIKIVSFEKIRLEVNDIDVPYATYINNGTARMVARPFMKDTPLLRISQRETIETYFNKVWHR